MKSNNWKDYISELLTKNGAFLLTKSETLNQTFIEFYESTITDNNSIFKIMYVNDVLMCMNLSNKDIPGYSYHSKGEYFFDSDFDLKRQSKTGLTFDLINRNGIKEELENGLEGKEEQYILDGKVVYSKLYLLDEHFVVNIDFSKRSFLQKLFGPKIPIVENTEMKTIDLNSIFSGI